jgi:HEPN domain-containing protein
MKPLVREWVAKAEADFASANRELRARKTPNYDAACFHAQQCAEKYLKARLQDAGIRFSKTHDLAVLVELLRPVEPEWELMRPGLRQLSSCAVETCYPGRSADKEEAREAVGLAKQVRIVAQGSLGMGAVGNSAYSKVARRRTRASRRRRNA